MLNPGSAGLTADRLGDADKWTAQEERTSSDVLLVHKHDDVVPK